MQYLEKQDCETFIYFLDYRYNHKSINFSSQNPVSVMHDIIDEGTITDAILNQFNTTRQIALNIPYYCTKLRERANNVLNSKAIL